MSMEKHAAPMLLENFSIKVCVVMSSEQFAVQYLQIIRVYICDFIELDPNIYIRSAEW